MQNTLIYRIGVGKALGLAVGLLCFWLQPVLVGESAPLYAWGLLLWYPTLGALAGVYGIFAYHPVLNFPMPWWFRGALLGAWMNLLLALFVGDNIGAMTISLFSKEHTPFWLILDGVIVCMIFDYLLTTWFGEGWNDN